MEVLIFFPKWLAFIIASAGAPIGTPWVAYQEAKILSYGAPLPEEVLLWAHSKGIADPESIRILYADTIPLPAPMVLRQMLGKYGYPTDRVAGLCLRKGIYLKTGIPLTSSILKHELIHTRQYQETGSIRAFLANYLYQSLAYSYTNCPFEREAQEESE